MTAWSDDQVDAAWSVLREEFSLGGYANVLDYLRGPDDPPPGPERDRALAALHEADALAEARVRDIIRRALVAAEGQAGATESTP